LPGDGDPRSRIAVRISAALAGLALLGSAACTAGGEPEPGQRTGPSAARLEGSILLTTGSSLGDGVAFLTLPGSVPTEVDDPLLEDIDFIRDAVFGDDGRAYVLIDRTEQTGLDSFDTETRLLAIPAVGPPRVIDTPQALLDHLTVADGRLLAVRCGGPNVSGVWAGAPTGGEVWWRVALGGCPGAISPDGRWHVWIRGGEVRRSEIGSGQPSDVIFDLGRVEGLRAAGIPRPRVFDVSLGARGLAVSVGDSFGAPEHGAVIVLPMPDGPGGAPAQADLVVLGEAYPSTLAWQPGGRLLAFLACVNCFAGFGFGQDERIGEVHVHDTTTGSTRQIVAGHETMTGLVWSPDGRALATLWRPNELLIVSAGGRVLGRRPVQGLPWDWRA
jgi:hypothetical protein